MFVALRGGQRKKMPRSLPTGYSWDDLLALDANGEDWELWTDDEIEDLLSLFGTRQSSVAPKSAGSRGGTITGCVISTTGASI